MELDHGNGNSKHLRTDIKGTDGIESDTRSGHHQGLAARNQSRKNLHQILDDEAGRGELSSEVSGSSMHLTKYIKLDVENGSSNQSDIYSDVINGVAGNGSYHFDINPEAVQVWGNKHNFEIQSGSTKQSEVIQEKDRMEGDIHNSGPKPEESSMQSLQDKHHVSGNYSYKLEECQNEDASLTLTSQVSSVAHETTSMKSPPVQVMDGVGVSDSYKIPSVVFARRSKEDWSFPSTESLFSIQLENYSFSRDHIVSPTSGEFLKSDKMGDTDEMVVESDKSKVTSVSDDALKDKSDPSVEEAIMKNPTRPSISWNPASITHNSVQPIAFPIRNMKKQRNCCNCWLAVCYSWKCTILTDAKSVASKEKAQQQQKEHPTASSVPSKSARCNCFSCISSCRRHCCGSSDCCRRNSSCNCKNADESVYRA